MRKNKKIILSALIKKCQALEVQAPNPDEQFVIDGGKFLQFVPWLANAETYDNILDEYIKYANQNYPPHSHFAMDGYEDEDSVKTCEQKCRIKGNMSHDIIFTCRT